MGTSSLGGGLYADGYYHSQLYNSNVINNSTKYVQSGGIYVADELTIKSSIIAGNNQNGSVNNCELKKGEVVNVTHTLISNDGQYACDIVSNEDNSNIVNISPKLASLSDNGCATKAGYGDNKGCVGSMKPLPNSPVINKGAADKDLETDQRGENFKRIASGQADIGALEIQSENYIVSGKIIGLNGTLEISNGTEIKRFSSDTSYRFEGYKSGDNYKIVIIAPKKQICTIENASGVVMSNITNVDIEFNDKRAIVVSGKSYYDGKDYLIISNGKEKITLSGKETDFSFEGYEFMDEYNISIIKQPKDMRCVVDKAMGVIDNLLFPDKMDLSILCVTIDNFIELSLNVNSKVIASKPFVLNLKADKAFCEGLVDWGDETNYQKYFVSQSSSSGSCLNSFSIKHIYEKPGVYVINASAKDFRQGESNGSAYLRVIVLENNTMPFLDSFEN